MRVLISGAAGFIGSHLVDCILRTTDWDIVVLDRFSYASCGLKRLKLVGAYDNPRVKIHVVNIAEPISHCLEKEIGHIDYILHLAAGSHVDNSIACPRDYIKDNIYGTFEMLEYARHIVNLKRFVMFSTDEVFGPAPEGYKYDEWDRFDPRNPYSACKAASEDLSLAWANTYDIPVIITHCQNVIGEMQHHEKFVPRVIRAALDGTEIKIHTDPKTGLSGSRNYFHAQDVADAVLFLLSKDVPVREKYNIAGPQEVSNLEVVLAVQKILGMHINWKTVNPTDVRPGFDVRYGLSGEKMAKMGWTAPNNFQEKLTQVMNWYVENQDWLRNNS